MRQDLNDDSIYHDNELMRDENNELLRVLAFIGLPHRLYIMYIRNRSPSRPTKSVVVDNEISFAEETVTMTTKCRPRRH